LACLSRKGKYGTRGQRRFNRRYFIKKFFLLQCRLLTGQRFADISGNRSDLTAAPWDEKRRPLYVWIGGVWRMKSVVR
jgi:hypothetical protein